MPLSTGAFAQSIEGCDKQELHIVQDAIRDAKQMTLDAATTVGDTENFNRWFGSYTQANAEVVRANLKSVVDAMRSGALTVECKTARSDGCEGGTYAWVYADEAYLLHLCPNYFRLPPLTALRPNARSFDFGTREGTIIHEVTHFLRVANTEDHCYSRSECTRMAAEDSARAIDNADSYQYFVEDVAHYARALPPSKTRAID